MTRLIAVLQRNSELINIVYFIIIIIIIIIIMIIIIMALQPFVGPWPLFPVS
jgi:hypothetical protein